MNGTQELQLVHPLLLFCLNFSACLFMCLFDEGFTALVPISVIHRTTSKKASSGVKTC